MFAEGTLLRAAVVKAVVPTLVGAGAFYVTITARSYSVTKTPAAVIIALAVGALFGLVSYYTDVRDDQEITNKVKEFKTHVYSYMVFWAGAFSAVTTIYRLYLLKLEGHRFESMGVEHAKTRLVKMVLKTDGWYVRLPLTN